MRWTLRYSSGAHSSRSWTHRRRAIKERMKLQRQHPELGVIVVVALPVDPPEHDLSPGHERLGG